MAELLKAAGIRTTPTSISILENNMPYHQVVYGDTLSKIAKKFNILHWALIYWHPNNQWKGGPHSLKVGQKIYIPELATPATKVSISPTRIEITRTRDGKPEDVFHADYLELRDKVELRLTNTTKELRKKKDATTKYQKAKTAMGKLAEVQWSGIVDKKDLKADWHFLWLVWFFELSPDSLGKWSSDKSSVEITREDYISDLRSRPHHQKALQRFKAKFPRLEDLAYFKEVRTSFVFTGPGTAKPGAYNAVEWFLGSYDTTIMMIGQEWATRRATIQVTVTNKSHWQSGTRVPAVFKNVGMPDYLVPDVPRGRSIAGGDFNQKFVWQESIQY